MADEYITIPEMTEASVTDIDNTSVVELAVVNTQSESGYVTRKSTLATLASYVLNKFSVLSLGGTVRTVKSAIDVVVSSIGDLTQLTTTAKSTLVEAINEAAESGGGSSITVDSALSSISENPVQNKVIKTALDAKANSADIPTVPVQSVNGATGAVVLDSDDVGAIAAPSSATSGQFLVYNGSAWVAQSLSTWQGGNY